MKSSHGHNMSIVNGIGRIGYMKGGGKALWKDENIADSITTHAIDFIKKNSNNPFFLYFATNDVHVPRFPHERFRGKSTMGVRGDAIVQFDWSVGKIMETLDKLGIADNTIVLLTSDNGPVVDDGYQDQAEELLNGHKPAGVARQQIQCLRGRYGDSGHRALAQEREGRSDLRCSDVTDRLHGFIRQSDLCHLP